MKVSSPLVNPTYLVSMQDAIKAFQHSRLSSPLDQLATPSSRGGSSTLLSSVFKEQAKNNPLSYNKAGQTSLPLNHSILDVKA